MAKFRKAISGGQTGADITSLECAKAIGLETGGTMPKGCKTDIGPKPEWKELYGLAESPSSDYAVRTRQNVRDADVTVWIGKVGSPGYWCTHNATKNQGKSFYVNPTELQLEYICNTYETVNFAGNRERLYPQVVEMTRQVFKTIARLLSPF